MTPSQSPAAALDAAIRQRLGEGATHAAAAEVVGENANAWRQYVRGARAATTGKVWDWVSHAGTRGWHLRVTWRHGGCEGAVERAPDDATDTAITLTADPAVDVKGM